nr:alpha-L-arabinofuranosidase C-terminal domain-containing protein [uncultured Bacteroides sp.]
MKQLITTFLLSCALGAQAQCMMTVDVSRPTAKIQPTMYGIFFEDINFGADGGLYAELVKNRSFEFPQPFVGWVPFGNVTVQDVQPCFDRNPHYVRIVNDGSLLRAGLDNEGYRGIGLKQGEEYRFTAYTRTPDARPMKLSIELVNSNGENPLKKEIEISGDSWQKQTVVLKSPFTDAHSRLRIVLLTEGTVDMDHISLFPVKTWKNRENGLRADLVQALYDLNPGVFRFPGGCIIEGNSLATRYQWKNSVGPVENRPLNENRWNYTFKYKAFPDYFQTLGLGFYEYFLLSEDLGAEPLPIVSCGLSCQYESNEVVPLSELAPYVQDALDLIEFANGAVTSKWGKVRAEMGHPEPFNLKMIGIGNEQWGKVYPERLEVFTKAIRAQYPDVKIVGSSGPSADGDKFDYLWPEMKRIGVDLVDEHYYMAPEWFLANATRYDNYDRKGPKVFAGEYASHDHATGKANNFLAALSEAAFMTGLERNADVVHLATYAPLFAHVDAWQWNPDLIWFDNLRMMRTPNYYVQQMYGMNAGTDVLPLQMDGNPVAGKDSLYATAALNAPTREVILKFVNVGSSPAKVRIDFNGLKKRRLLSGSCTYMQSSDLKAVNTLEQEVLLPRVRPVKVKAQSLSLELQPRSFEVYRLTLSVP